MARRKPKQPAINPKLLYVGGGLIAAVLAFAIVNFLFLNKSGGGADTSLPTAVPGSVSGTHRASVPKPTPAPVGQSGLGEGRDPFKPLVSQTRASSAPAVAVPSVAAVAPPQVAVRVLSVAEDGSVASIQIGASVHNGVKPGSRLENGIVIDQINKSCVLMHDAKGSFTVCSGQSVLK